MNKPKTNWRVEAKKFKKQNNVLFKNYELRDIELIELSKQFEKSKQIWSRQEDEMQREISTLNKQVGNLYSHNKNLAHAISVLSEQLINHEINRERYSMFIPGENTHLVEASQMMNRDK